MYMYIYIFVYVLYATSHQLYWRIETDGTTYQGFRNSVKGLGEIPLVGEELKILLGGLFISGGNLAWTTFYKNWTSLKIEISITCMYRVWS